MVEIEIDKTNLASIMAFIGLDNLHWSILHLWAISKKSSDIDILNLEEKTKEKSGYNINFNSLINIAKQLEQVNECTIVGVKSIEDLPDRNLPLENLKNVCDVVIEAVDSSYWNIYLKDEKLSNKMIFAINSGHVWNEDTP